jgi:hypothetical protein
MTTCGPGKAPEVSVEGGLSTIASASDAIGASADHNGCADCDAGFFSVGTNLNPCVAHDPCDIGQGRQGVMRANSTLSCEECAGETYSADSSTNNCHDVTGQPGIERKDASSVECAVGYAGTPEYDSSTGAYSGGCAECDGANEFQDERGQTACKDIPATYVKSVADASTCGNEQSSFPCGISNSELDCAPGKHITVPCCCCSTTSSVLLL